MITTKHNEGFADNQYRDSFDLLFHEVSDYLFIMDQTGKVVRLNKAALEKLGYTVDEIDNIKFDLLHPTSRCSERTDIFRNLVLLKEMSCCHITLYTKLGERVFWEVRVFESTWEGERFFYVIAKEQLEWELANQKKFLKTMLDTIPDYIFYKDIDGVYLGCNKANAEKYLGVNEDEVKGKTDFDFLKDNELVKFYWEQDQQIFLTGRTLKFDSRYVLTDGSFIDAETVKAPFWDERGNLAGLIGVARDITDRKKLEKQLKKQVDYAELLFSTVPSAVFSVDKDNKIIRWNKTAEEITGYTQAEVIGKVCSLVLHGRVIEERCKCCRIIDSEIKNKMCKLITKNGEIKYILRSMAILKDETGQIREKLSCFEDITGMINMELELRESKGRYAAIVNNAPQLVAIHKDGVIKFINDVGKEVMGYEDEYIGRNIWEFISEDSIARVHNGIRDRVIGKDSNPYEIKLIKSSGEIINVLLKGTEITYNGEKATLAVMLDITESKQLNAKLQASEEKFRQLAETINEIFLITDKERIVYVSPAYERISGMSCQSLLDNHRSLVDLIHPLDREKILAAIFHGFEDLNYLANKEFRIIRPDGEIRWLWLQSYPVRSRVNGSSQKAISIVDITDRKKIEDELCESEKQTHMELQLASQVQLDSLPSPYNGDRVRVSTIFKPYNLVSGDFFNYKWLEATEKLCGYIIDVSGHGVATALQTATFKMMLDNVLLTGEKIDESDIRIINQRVINYLYEDSFVALLYFEFDIQTAELKLISAGITLFLVATPNECQLVPISGCYLGLIDDPYIETMRIPFKEGEIYCLMSDGASDLLELYGINKQKNFERYKNWLEKLAETTDRIDDFSVICIEILPKRD